MPSKTVSFQCSNCGKEFHADLDLKKRNKHSVCCSLKCKGEYMTKRAIANIPVKTDSHCISCNQTKPISEFYKDKKCRARAHKLVNNAVKNGDIIKPKYCSVCEKVGRLHSHHWNGYDHPYDIVWLCPSCHHAAHGRGLKSRLKSK